MEVGKNVCMTDAFGSVNKLVSFSVFGSDSKYLEGVKNNVEVIYECMPGWGVVIYCDSLNHASLKDFDSRILLICRERASSGLEGMFWRYEACGLPNADAVIFRDSDSLIGAREIDLVNEWLRASQEVHIIRDHPTHSVPIMGGMFGVRGSARISLYELIKSRTSGVGTAYFADQDFLGRQFYPLIKSRALVHTNHVRFLGEYALPIRGALAQEDFIGAYSFAKNDERERWLKLWRESGPKTYLLHCWQGPKLARSIAKRLPVGRIKFGCRWCL